MKLVRKKMLEWGVCALALLMTGGFVSSCSDNDDIKANTESILALLQGKGNLSATGYVKDAKGNYMITFSDGSTMLVPNASVKIVDGKLVITTAEGSITFDMTGGASNGVKEANDTYVLRLYQQGKWAVNEKVGAFNLKADFPIRSFVVEFYRTASGINGDKFEVLSSDGRIDSVLNNTKAEISSSDNELNIRLLATDSIGNTTTSLGDPAEYRKFICYLRDEDGNEHVTTLGMNVLVPTFTVKFSNKDGEDLSYVYNGDEIKAKLIINNFDVIAGYTNDAELRYCISSKRGMLETPKKEDTISSANLTIDNKRYTATYEIPDFVVKSAEESYCSAGNHAKYVLLGADAASGFLPTLYRAKINNVVTDLCQLATSDTIATVGMYTTTYFMNGAKLLSTLTQSKVRCFDDKVLTPAFEPNRVPEDEALVSDSTYSKVLIGWSTTSGDTTNTVSLDQTPEKLIATTTELTYSNATDTLYAAWVKKEEIKMSELCDSLNSASISSITIKFSHIIKQDDQSEGGYGKIIMRLHAKKAEGEGYDVSEWIIPNETIMWQKEMGCDFNAIAISKCFDVPGSLIYDVYGAWKPGYRCGKQVKQIK